MLEKWWLHGKNEEEAREKLYREAYSSFCAIVSHINCLEMAQSFVRLLKGTPVGRLGTYRVWDIPYKNCTFSLIFNTETNEAEPAEIEGGQMQFYENEDGTLYY